jgi:hypothetical protein
MACQLCQECIETSGLNGCGKRGVLAAAKSLSGDKVPENRMAALDLMETILSRMNGDTQRLTRICGPILSEKALYLLQERWQKRETKPHSSLLLPEPSRPGAIASPKSSRGATKGQTASTPTNIYDELPALSLRLSSKERAPQNLDPMSNDKEEAADLFAFPRPLREPTQPDLDTVDVQEIGYATPRVEDEERNGAAASLRARLMKIREKSKVSQEIAGQVQDKDDLQFLENDNTEESLSAEIIYEKEMDVIRTLLEKNAPLSEDDPDLVACIDTLKQFHAALSRQHNAAAGLSFDDLLKFRDCISRHMNPTVEQLTR